VVIPIADINAPAPSVYRYLQPTKILGAPLLP